MTLDELCLKLAEKRKALNLSLEEVVEKTKLYPSVIRDIEGGNLNNINPAYRKGFLRIYASFLGIDTESCLDKEFSVIKSEVKPQASRKNNEERPKKLPVLESLSPKAKKIIVFSLVGIFILWSATGFIGFVAKKIRQAPKKTAKKIALPVRATITQSKNKEVVVSVTAKRNCILLRVKADGKLLFDGLLSKGAVESWKAAREIELKINDGSAVYIEVNSKPLAPLTTAHKAIKSLKITASGISVVK